MPIFRLPAIHVLYPTIGLLVLAFVRPLSAQSIQGQVLDRSAGNAPVRAGTIRLLDVHGEVTRVSLDVNGRFNVTAPEPGRYWLRFESPGYRMVLSSGIDLAPRATVSYSIQTQAVAPAELDTVVVEGRGVPVRVAPFYERRARPTGGGEFFTRQEFERWNPAEVTDVIRRSRGFTVVPNPGYSVGGDFRRNVVINNRIGMYLGSSCPPLVYIDGMYMGSSAQFDLEFVDVNAVEGVEIYNSIASLPLEFSRQGSDCGVISIWTRVSTDVAQSSWRHIDFGPQLGARFGEQGVRDARLGGQMSLGVGPIELQGAANIIVPLLGRGVGEAHTGWQIVGSARIRPLGRRSAWYLGPGFSSVDVNQYGRSTPFVEPVQENHFVALTGLSLPLGLTRRTFMEFHLLSPFSSERQVHGFAGLMWRVY